MKCKNCGTEIGKDIKFCPNCGNKIQKQCPMCGQEIEEGMKFCVSCGAKLLDDEAVNNNVYATEQKAESTKAQEETTRPEVTKSVHRTNTSFMQELDALAEKDENTRAVISWVGKGYLQKWLLPFLRDDEQIVSFWHIQQKKFFSGRLHREFVVLTTRRVICFVKRQYMKSQIKSCSLKDILSVDTADQESNAIHGTLIGEKIDIVASNGTISVRMVGKGQAKELKQAIEFLIGQADLVKDFVSQPVNGINVQKGKRSTFDIVAIILSALLLVLLGVYLFSPTKSMTTATPPTIPTTTATPTNDLSSLFDADTNELKSFIDNESLSYDGENQYINDAASEMASTNTGEKQTTSENFQIGEVVTTDNFEFTVTNAYVLDNLGAGKKVPEGAVYVVVEYEYKNISKQAISSWDLPKVKLADGNDAVYSQDMDADWYFDGYSDSKIMSDMNPGIKSKDAKIFEVAIEVLNAGGMKVYVQADQEFLVDLNLHYEYIPTNVYEEGYSGNVKADDYYEEFSNENENVGDAGYGYILEDSARRYLTEDELINMSKEELRLARNEIFARHGRKFDALDLQSYFNSMEWYYGTVPADEFDESVLNEYEKANLVLIKDVEMKK